MKTDARLRAALKEVTSDAVVLIVAQRVSTIKDADQIVVLDNGKVVGKGRHYELVLKCPIYQSIVKSQLSDKEFKSELAKAEKEANHA
jgi:ATP-binding cassette subfamily B protein